VLAGGLAAFTDEAKAFADDFIESKAGEPWHDAAVAAISEEENGEIDDLGALWQRQAPLYFAHWDERYRPAMVAAAVGAAGEPLLEFNEVGFDVRDELSAITAPTLIVCGAQDFICGPPAAQVLERGVAGAQLVMLEGAGHMMFVERPDAFRAAVAGFLGAA
jgi:proline iminopeptidase